MSAKFVDCLQIFPSASIEETTTFYEKIGFRAVRFLDVGEPHVCLYRDGIEIVLTQSALPKISPNHLVHGYGEDAYFITTDQAEMQAELQQKGVRIVRPLALTDYSNLEFIFEDNEGRWIAVGCKVA